MGMLVDGHWQEDADNFIQDGAFKRKASTLAHNLSAQIFIDQTANTNRYIMVASMSCPWSHRALLVRAVKGLTSRIPLRIAGGARIEGYAINPDDFTDDPVGQPANHLHQLYTATDSAFTGRGTIPIIWDRLDGNILSNDSAKIMRELNDVPGTPDYTLTPASLVEAIDDLNDQIHVRLSNGVYRAGLAQKQRAYDDAIEDVFATLASLEERLAKKRYLFGQVITETDWRLFPTLVRFDSVYATHFRCTKNRLIDFPNLWGYARDLYSWQNVADTIDFQTNLEGYYLNDGDQNPHGIIGAMPDIEWTAPHQRAGFGPAQIWTRVDGPKTIDSATFLNS